VFVEENMALSTLICGSIIEELQSLSRR